MTVGYSGTYGVDGVDFILQPTKGKWGTRKELGIDGNGHPIYPSTREFELTWGLMPTNAAKQLIDKYNAVSSTGTATFDLPEYGNLDYKFKSYSGTTMFELEVGEYFQGYITDVTLKINNIRNT